VKAVAVGAAGAGFLLAVLWFDLMFDVQARGSIAGEELPVAARDSIAAYYRRVTTAARPMNMLIAAVMVATLGALIVEVAHASTRSWEAWASLLLALFAIGFAALRTVRNARRFGTQRDTTLAQSALARSILRDHVLCGVAIAAVVVLQVLLA
jgi:hypothetical protein